MIIDNYHIFVPTRITSDFIYCANRFEVVEFENRSWFITQIIKEPQVGLYLTEADEGVLAILEKLQRERHLNLRMKRNPEKYFYCRGCFNHQPVKGRVYGMKGKNEIPDFYCRTCASVHKIFELITIQPKTYNRSKTKFYRQGDKL